MRTSTTTAPAGSTITGFRSISRISGQACSTCEARTSRRRSAASSAAGAPRNPRRRTRPLTRSTSARAPASAERAHREGRVVEQIDQHAAGPAHHYRTEGGVVDAADDHLDAAGHHRLHQHRFERGRRACRRARQTRRAPPARTRARAARRRRRSCAGCRLPDGLEHDGQARARARRRRLRRRVRAVLDGSTGRPAAVEERLALVRREPALAFRDQVLDDSPQRVADLVGHRLGATTGRRSHSP